MTTTTKEERIHKFVKTRYGAVARTSDRSLEGCDPGACCTPDSLYPVEMIGSVPEEAAAISLGCGNPIDGANVQPGETVLDLGSGGGIDCFLAAQRVGARGRVIGVDMTPEMLAKARANLATLRASGGPTDYGNIEFRQGLIESIPVEDDSVDVIVSNCVINLAPDKTPVFREMHRVLKPGGRVHVSDMVTNGPMSPEIAQDERNWAACLAGALPANEFAAGLRAVGFEQVDVHTDPALSQNVAALPDGMPYSAIITARKPG